MSITEKNFYNLSKGSLSLIEVTEEIRQFVFAQPEREYKVIIGSDSATKNPVSVVSTVTVWRVGNGGMYFWTRARERAFYTLHDRIYDEALQSIMLAQELKSRLGEIFGIDMLERQIEVHLDIGLFGPTKTMVDQIVGMVKGYGFDPVIKPSAFGASSVADRHT